MSLVAFGAACSFYLQYSLFSLVVVAKRCGLFRVIRFLIGRNKQNHGTNGLRYIHLGFALTPSYGTFSMRNEETDSLTAGLVEGSTTYRRTMSKLSKSSSMHPYYPHGNFDSVWNDYPRQMWRDIRKSCGLAASPDVDAIASLLNPMKEQIERHVGHGIDGTSVILAMPSLVALYDEDVKDALEFIGLFHKSSNLSVSPPREMCTAYIGHMARNPDYDLDIPEQRVLCVELTRESFSLEVRDTSWVLALESWHVETTRTSFQLGHARSHEDIYWKRLEQLIEEVNNFYNYKEKPPKIDTVLLIGDKAEDEPWRKVFDDIIGNFGNPSIYSSDPSLVAAKGASRLSQIHDRQGHQAAVDLGAFNSTFPLEKQ